MYFENVVNTSDPPQGLFKDCLRKNVILVPLIGEISRFFFDKYVFVIYSLELAFIGCEHQLPSQYVNRYWLLSQQKLMFSARGVTPTLHRISLKLKKFMKLSFLTSPNHSYVISNGVDYVIYIMKSLPTNWKTLRTQKSLYLL